MDLVKIKVLIDGKVKYYADKDDDGFFYLIDNKSDGKIVESMQCQDIFPEMREYFHKLGYDVKLIKENVK